MDGEKRYRQIVTKTSTGIKIEWDSLYGDYQHRMCYYRTYPAIPANWQAPINDDMTTEAEKWFERLVIENHAPYRTVNL